MSDERHSTDAAPCVNGIPDTGKFTAEQFAVFFSRKPDTIRDWVDKYKIPHYKPGDTMIIDAQTFWQYVPLIDFEQEE